MNCPNCGFLLPDDSKFCQYCGTVLSGNAPGSEPAHTPAASEAFAPDAAPPASAAPDYTAPPSAQAAAAFLAAAPSQAAVPSRAAVPGTRYPGGAGRHTRKGEKIKKCKACGAQIDPRTKKCSACGKPAFRVQPMGLVLAAVSAALVCSLVINFLQYGSAVQMRQKLESSNATITAQKSAILDLENQLTEKEAERQRLKARLFSANTKLEQAQKKADYFDSIRHFLASSDAGYASNRFYASESLLILNRTDGDQTFSLTTSFSGNSSISVSTTGNSADVQFTEDSWHDRTTIRVTPKATGATYATFSNDLNSQTFRVLVIVTE